MQVVTTVLKFVPLAVIGIVGLFFIDGGNYEPFAPHGTSIGLLSSTAALTLWAFIGLESATVPAEEVKDPERTIPRATIIGTLARDRCVYIVATVAIMGIIPTDQLAASTSPFADAAGQVFGGGWDKVIAAGRAGLDVRRAQRLDPAPGPRAAGGRRGRHVPARRSHASTASAGRRCSASSSRRSW